jgi:hypothetical protein
MVARPWGTFNSRLMSRQLLPRARMFTERMRGVASKKQTKITRGSLIIMQVQIPDRGKA